MNINTANNINTARRQANSYAKAQEIIKEGYCFHKDADSDVIAVIKPGTTAAAYWINMIEPGCDCPDYMKHPGTFCKHTMAWDILQEEAAMWEAQCAEYDATH